MDDFGNVDYYHNTLSTTNKRDFKAAFKSVSRAANLTKQPPTVPERLAKDWSFEAESGCNRCGRVRGL